MKRSNDSLTMLNSELGSPAGENTIGRTRTRPAAHSIHPRRNSHLFKTHSSRAGAGPTELALIGAFGCINRSSAPRTHDAADETRSARNWMSLVGR